MLDADDITSATETTDTTGTAENAETAAADQSESAAKKTAAKRATAKKTAAKKTTAKKAPAKKTAARKTTAKKAAKKAPEPAAESAAAPEAAESATGADPSAPAGAAAETSDTGEQPAKKTAARKTTAKKAAAKKTTKAAGQPQGQTPADPEGTAPEGADSAAPAGAAVAAVPLFQPPEPVAAPPRRRKAEPPPEPAEERDTAEHDSEQGDDGDEQGGGRRRRRRGGRRRRKGAGEDGDDSGDQPDDRQESKGGKPDAAKQGAKDGRDTKDSKAPKVSKDTKDTKDEGGDSESSTSRRRRRRRRSGENGDNSADDPENTVTRVRKGRSPEDEITALSGSTRLEAKKQRRREGREAGRRRAPIVSEAEFLARREAVDRVMVIRQRKDLTQIAVLEDKVLVEHYVARESQASLIGNVYLGRVQNVLPSMEAAFIDIGKGRNAVLYAGEVNWDSLGAGNGPRKIEQVLKSGQSVLVQVTKDPVGHKGARLTSQISLPGRFLVYVPDGTTSGISRKLPDTERNRLKNLLKEIVPESAGVIVRTAAEGASEEELTRDVERLTARWEDISTKIGKGGEKGGAPQLLYGEPDLTLKVVRDLFTEDFGKLVVSGDEAWDTVEAYVDHVAPDLADRLERFGGDDVFAAYRIDEQIEKALDRKVWLPSGGSLIIDRTEAMTVVDVNTGKFTGSGGNLEETVTKNNLEAAEEIVRQLRLRDIGGIIVVDFIDMVLESNRDLVLRRLVECLGRDRTRHQVAEVTSLGLVQMTRKRIGTGLLEAFSESCEHCHGRGLVTRHEPVDPRKKQDDEPRRSRRGRGGRGSNDSVDDGNHREPGTQEGNGKPSPKDFAVMAGSDRVGQPADADSGTSDETPDASELEPATPARGAKTSRSRSRSSRSQASSESAESSKSSDKDQGDRVDPISSDEPAASAGPAAPAGTATESRPEPAKQTDPEPAPVDSAPRLVSSSRRRVARRPAGPPAADGAGSQPAPQTLTPSAAESQSQSGSGVESEHESEPQAAAHVPVKKKGSRKR